MVTAREKLLEAAEAVQPAPRLIDQIREHKDIIDGLRAKRMPWPKIAELLAGAGIRRLDGQPIPAGDLSSMYSRLTRRSEPAQPQLRQPTRPVAPVARASRGIAEGGRMPGGGPVPDVAAILAEGASPRRPATDIDEFLGGGKK